MTVLEALAALEAHPVQVAMIEIQHPEIGKALKVLARDAKKEIRENKDDHSRSR